MTADVAAADSDPQTRPARRAALGAVLILLAAYVAPAGWPERDGPAVSPGSARLLLDPNAATRAELMLLPGIGEELASRIVTYRNTVGDRPAFRTAADLDDVRGIGPKRVEQMRAYLRFTSTSSDLRESAP